MTNENNKDLEGFCNTDSFFHETFRFFHEGLGDSETLLIKLWDLDFSRPEDITWFINNHFGGDTSFDIENVREFYSSLNHNQRRVYRTYLGISRISSLLNVVRFIRLQGKGLRSKENEIKTAFSDETRKFDDTLGIMDLQNRIERILDGYLPRNKIEGEFEIHGHMDYDSPWNHLVVHQNINRLWNYKRIKDCAIFSKYSYLGDYWGNKYTPKAKDIVNRIDKIDLKSKKDLSLFLRFGLGIPINPKEVEKLVTYSDEELYNQLITVKANYRELVLNRFYGELFDNRLQEINPYSFWDSFVHENMTDGVLIKEQKRRSVGHDDDILIDKCRYKDLVNYTDREIGLAAGHFFIADGHFGARFELDMWKKYKREAMI